MPIKICSTCRKWSEAERMDSDPRVIGVCKERLEGNQDAVPKKLRLSEVFTYGDCPARCPLYDERWIDGD